MALKNTSNVDDSVDIEIMSAVMANLSSRLDRGVDVPLVRREDLMGFQEWTTLDYVDPILNEIKHETR